VIVPANVLDQLTTPALNIHPGPPEFPGIYPSAFALYARSPFFGTTLHQMTAKIDDGPIIMAPRFPIPEGCTRADLDRLSYQHILKHLDIFLPVLISETAPPLSPIERWAPPYNSLADFKALCQIDLDLSKEDFDHRLRSLGIGPNHGLELPFHGYNFRILPPENAVLQHIGTKKS